MDWRIQQLQDGAVAAGETAEPPKPIKLFVRETKLERCDCNRKASWTGGVFSLGEVWGTWRVIRHFCRECFKDEVQKYLGKYRDKCEGEGTEFIVQSYPPGKAGASIPLPKWFRLPPRKRKLKKAIVEAVLGELLDKQDKHIRNAQPGVITDRKNVAQVKEIEVLGQKVRVAGDYGCPRCKMPYGCTCDGTKPAEGSKAAATGLTVVRTKQKFIYSCQQCGFETNAGLEAAKHEKANFGHKCPPVGPEVATPPKQGV